MAFGVLLGVTVFQVVIAVVLVTFGATLFLGSPWVPTNRDRARRMLQFAAVAPGETLLDLGSGNGAILFCAVEDFGVRQAVGYEINPLLVWWSRLRARLRRSGKSVVTESRNMFVTPLPKVNVVATFLIPSTMKRLQEKFATELDPDTRIISRGFKIPGVTPLKKQEGPETWLYLYRAGDLR